MKCSCPVLALLGFLVLALPACGGVRANSYDSTRYDLRPDVAGTEDEVLVPIVISDCGFQFREDPPTAQMRIEPDSPAWLQGSIHVTLDIVPVQDVGCLFHEVGHEPIVAARIGTLAPGVHRITYEVRRFLEGETKPYGSSSGEHYAGILRHSRFESGFWFEPDNPGHGMSLIVRSGRTREQYDENGDPAGYATPQSLYFSWQTYDTEGHPLWLLGSAPDGEAQPLRADVYRHEGMRYPSLESADLQGERWGEAIITPVTCGRLDVTWRPAAPGLAERTIQFQRLVGTEEVPYCEPHPSWLTVPARLAEP